jgi:ketosteroid isomerase-like protein
MVRRLNDAIQDKDVDAVVSMYAEDAILVVPEGTFEGRKEIRRYWEWQIGMADELEGTETEIMAQGDKAAAEHVYSVRMVDGGIWRAPISCLYEFKDERIRRHRMSYDRLSIAEQAATGWLASRLVGSIVGRMEEGLEQPE